MIEELNQKVGVTINIGVLGTGKYVPPLIYSNDDLATMVDTSDEWIKSRTGIEQRRIAQNETTSDLASKAAIEALKAANTEAKDIDLIIVATLTPDAFTPSTSCLVQDKIGASNAACFDLSAACSGFAYALTTAYQFIKTGTYRKALIIGAEVLSKITDWKDRNTCVLFGDGAGAAVLGHKENADILGIYNGADGSKGSLLTSYSGLFGGEKYIQMDGREVYKFATSIMKTCVDEVLKDTEYTIDDVDQFVLHQANIRIINSIRRKLKLDETKFYTNMDKYGNTSSASIPIALDEMCRQGKIKDGDKVILAGFGGGLTWSSLFMVW